MTSPNAKYPPNSQIQDKLDVCAVSRPTTLNSFRESAILLALIIAENNEVVQPVTTPKEISNLLQQFEDIWPTELSSSLPPLRAIQHQIDFVLNASLPNHPHYKISLKEYQILQ